VFDSVNNVFAILLQKYDLAAENGCFLRVCAEWFWSASHNRAVFDHSVQR
jgi:hypothetical protein